MKYQFAWRHLTLDNLSRSNQGHMTFKRLYLLNGASYQIVHYIINHIYGLSVYLMTFDLSIKRSNQGPLVSLGVYHRQCIINSGAFRPRGLLFTWRQFSQKLFNNFFSIYAISFPRRVLMHCQKMDSIESL